MPQGAQTLAPAQMACADVSVALTGVSRTSEHRSAPAVSYPVPAQAACGNASAASLGLYDAWAPNVPSQTGTWRVLRLLVLMLVLPRLRPLDVCPPVPCLNGLILTSCNHAGTHGKTTTSWMIRGILEEPEQPGDPEGLVGMIGSLEYAIHSDRLDDEGEIWLPKTSSQEDPSVGRSVSGCSLDLLGPGVAKAACCHHFFLGLGAFKGLPPLGMHGRASGRVATCLADSSLLICLQKIGRHCAAVQTASPKDPPVGRHGPDCLL